MSNAPQEFNVPVDKFKIKSGLGYETMWSVEEAVTSWKARNDSSTPYSGFEVEVEMTTLASTAIFRRTIKILSYKLLGNSKNFENPGHYPDPEDRCRYTLQIEFCGQRYKTSLYLPSHNCHIYINRP